MEFDRNHNLNRNSKVIVVVLAIVVALMQDLAEIATTAPPQLCHNWNFYIRSTLPLMSLKCRFPTKYPTSDPRSGSHESRSVVLQTAAQTPIPLCTALNF